MKYISAVPTLGAWSVLAVAGGSIVCAQPALSLRDAIKEALAAHPALAIGVRRTQVAEGLRRQAELRPNPRLVLLTENLRAHGEPEFRFSRDTDTFSYLSWPFETGGKRERRVEAASAAVQRAELERELAARQIAGRIKLSYWAAAGAAHVRDLLIESGRTFDQIIDYHRIRVREGAMAEADLLRVQLEGDRMLIALNAASLEAERARIQLFREMGRTGFPEVRLTDALQSEHKTPPVADVRRALDERIEIRLARRGVEQARAIEAVARAAARPNVDIVLGFKRTAGFNTLMGGAQIDLPFLNRNEGNIAAAQAEVRVAESSLAAAEAIVRAEVEAAGKEFEIRRRQLTQTLGPMQERAQETARIALAAYREGGTDLLRLLDAQRLRIDTQLLYYRTLTEYRQSIAELENAMGMTP